MTFWSVIFEPNFPNVRFLPSNVYFLGHIRPPLKSDIIYVRSVIPNIKCKYKCSFTNLVPEMEYALKGKDMREHCQHPWNGVEVWDETNAIHLIEQFRIVKSLKVTKFCQIFLDDRCVVLFELKVEKECLKMLKTILKCKTLFKSVWTSLRDVPCSRVCYF